MFNIISFYPVYQVVVMLCFKLLLHDVVDRAVKMCFRLLLDESQKTLKGFLNFIFFSMGELSRSPHVQISIRNIFIGAQVMKIS